MMIPDNYEINVARMEKDYTGDERYRHYCRIQLDDSFEKDAIEKFNELNQMFQVNGDYHLSLTKVTCRGEQIRV